MMFRVYANGSEVYKSRSEQKARMVFRAVCCSAEVLAKYTDYNIILDRDGEEIDKIERL